MGHLAWLWDRVLAVVNIDWDGDWADWPWTAPTLTVPVNPERALIDATHPEASPHVDCPFFVEDLGGGGICAYCGELAARHSPRALEGSASA